MERLIRFVHVSGHKLQNVQSCSLNGSLYLCIHSSMCMKTKLSTVSFSEQDIVTRLKMIHGYTIFKKVIKEFAVSGEETVLTCLAYR